MIDGRLTLQTYEGQRSAIQDLFMKLLNEEIETDTVKTAVALIREARMIVQAESDDARKNQNAAVDSLKNTSAVTPNGPFPKLIGRS